MADQLNELTAAGVAIWLDDLSAPGWPPAASPAWCGTTTAWA
jgi:hypothetical protein